MLGMFKWANSASTVTARITSRRQRSAPRPAGGPPRKFPRKRRAQTVTSSMDLKRRPGQCLHGQAKVTEQRDQGRIML